MDYARSINSAVALLVSIILIIIVAVGLIIPPDKPKTDEAGIILPQMCGQGEPCGARITSDIFVWIIMLMFPGLFMAVFFVQEAENGRIDEL